ncbi:polysaccharide deacetylase family protein [Sphingomonas sanguinis]|uniref:polysaccharide deacetylase family protein n=1 Tax=Sphingomonas sanguinis TaxID=33051 RepID=UPI001C57C49A|nr:polysaccharide deacetylase family protein [Sphingomonas sanguinis]QXT34821.1 polysaccharide deacetylase family protein [Sphingomonas sanguinis]
MIHGGKRLLASIHDVSPRFESEVDELVDRLQDHLGGPRFAMLVIPDHWNSAPILRGDAFASRLRRWSESGIEVVLHGWNHLDRSRHRGVAGLKGRHMTAGEGEFLGMGREEALRRLRRGRSLLEDITGSRVDMFVAPAWLYSEGARIALAEEGFRIAEDHWRVWSPEKEDKVLARGPVVTWASRSAWRRISSRAAAAVLRASLHPLPTVRVAVHPGDLNSDRLIASIDRTFAAFADRRPMRYADLLGGG